MTELDADGTLVKLDNFSIPPYPKELMDSVLDKHADTPEAETSSAAGTASTNSSIEYYKLSPLDAFDLPLENAKNMLQELLSAQHWRQIETFCSQVQKYEVDHVFSKFPVTNEDFQVGEDAVTQMDIDMAALPALADKKARILFYKLMGSVYPSVNVQVKHLPSDSEGVFCCHIHSR